MGDAQSERDTTLILMYHEIVPADEVRHPYEVSEKVFERHLERMREAGLGSTSFASYRNGAAAAEDRETKTTILTFDDAQATNYSVALPVLKKHGFGATFFIPTAFVGRDAGQVTMGQLREMHEQGMEIQSHSHSHPYLDELSYPQLLDELGRSKNILEQGLGATVDILACPGGRYNRATLRAAAETGYLGVCTSRPGLGLRSRSTSPYVFDRILISASTSDSELAGTLEGQRGLFMRKRLAYQVKNGLKRALGNKLYHLLWSRLPR